MRNYTKAELESFRNKVWDTVLYIRQVTTSIHSLEPEYCDIADLTHKLAWLIKMWRTRANVMGLSRYDMYVLCENYFAYYDWMEGEGNDKA